MPDRLLFTIGLALLGIGLYVAAQSVHLRDLERRLAQIGQRVVPGLDAFQPGKPAVLLFSTDHCVPCRTVLQPALRRLSAELEHRFQVLKINAELQPEAARYWRVLSVPTVFVLDPQGKPRHVHYGLVRPEVLRTQLNDWLLPGEAV